MTTNPPSPVLAVRGVAKEYAQGMQTFRALHDVSFEMPAGTWLAVTGSSGAGKTTLLNILAGLDAPTAGSVHVDGCRLDDLPPAARTDFRRRHIGYVFQFFNLLPTMSARDNVALPLLAERLAHDEIDERTAAALAAVGMTHLAARRPTELSGGEQQRVGIARALVMRPRLLLADEPTGNLDSSSGRSILELVRRTITATGLAVVMVTHSHAAARAADRVFAMRDGRLLDGEA